MLFPLKWIDHSLQSNGKEFFFLQKTHFGNTPGMLSAKHIDSLFHNGNYSEGSLNGFVHESDKKLHCLCIPCGLQVTFIHFVMDFRK